MFDDPEPGVSFVPPVGPLGPEAQAPEPPDYSKIEADIRKKFQEARRERRKHEPKWFVNGAFLRGSQHVEYNDTSAQLVSPVAPSYKVRVDLNRIRPKIRARLSKFFKNRPRPTVVPASIEYDDYLNAKATEKVIAYHWSRLHLEEAYKDARLWASITGHGYWWFYIDMTAEARVQTTDPVTRNTQVETVPNAGDICIEVSSPFEVLVADPSISRIGNQPWIQRVRLMDKDDIVSRYPHMAESLDHDAASATAKGDTEHLSNYANRLSTLTNDSTSGGSTTVPHKDKQVLLLEHFEAPNAKYPKGRYVVMAADKVVRVEEELPYELHDHKTNPYPVVEFTDAMTPGQYWATTFIEQLIDLQRQYNFLFELLIENARAVARPKIIVYKQHNLPDGAWTNAAGEIIELSYVPGLPPPMILNPANIAGDVWNLINVYDRLFDEISQIYPASEGQVATATSGFQTNLLQEASESVHAPDVREDELSLEEAAWKIRRLCRLWYDIPRLIGVFGESAIPELLEFSNKQINEYAEVRIQAGSMLPEMKAARAQTALELYTAGLFGPADDPTVRKRVLNLLDMNGLEAAQAAERRDGDVADMENQRLAKYGNVDHSAMWYEDHLAHLDKHTAFMKSPSYSRLDPQVQAATMAHAIGHLDWVNPGLAQALRLQHGLNVPPTTPPPSPPAPGSTEPAEAGALQPPQMAPPPPPPPLG